MRDIKHTPGPWSFYDDSNDGKTNRIEIVAIGKTVARIYHSVPDEDLPNARLIVAAPDMALILEMLAAEADAGTVMIPSALRLTIDAALIKAGRKDAPERDGA